MNGTLHAFEFFKTSDHLPGSIIVLFGDDGFLKRESLRHLKSLILTDGDDDLSFREFDGDQATWSDVIDELATVSLFDAGGQRVVSIRAADPFVKANRDKLEDLSEQSLRSNLILQVNQWQSNLRLYKAVEKSGLQIDCRVPEKKKGKRSEIDLDQITSWMCHRAKQSHEVKLSKELARHILELIGHDFGMLDQELAKLALYAGDDKTITREIVDQTVVGWQTKTIWEAIDAAVGGATDQALFHLERLFHSGNEPQALYGQISWSLKRYSHAARSYDFAERTGQHLRLEDALKQAGFRDWPPGTISKEKQRLSRIGRRRAIQLADWLLDLDLALKGSHSQRERGRHAIENLFLQLATSQ